ncbi:MAG TPA: class I SAM-dependent methyltransferase [Pseudonocardiaceae bacterium]
MIDDERPEGLARLRTALAARAQLKTWSEGAELIELVRAVHRAGWLTRLRQEATAEDLATIGGAPVEQVANVLAVLTGAGVTEGKAGVFRLSPTFDALVAGTTGVDLGETLDGLDLVRGRVALATGREDGMTGQQALVVARDWGIGPTEDAQQLYQALYASIPEYRARLEKGGPLLDVGCGIGAAVLTTATMYGDLRAVAIEVVPEVAVETRRRAEEAGVADRVEIRTADARTLTEESAFEISFWAQPFFDPSTRADTLAVIFRALRPGGLLLVQELFPPVSEEDGPNVRGLLDRLVLEQQHASFGRTAEDLAAEAAEAGFRDAEIRVNLLGRLVLTRKP